MAGVVNTLLLGHTGTLLLRNISTLHSGDIFTLINLDIVRCVLALVRLADLVSDVLTLRCVVSPALALLYGAALNVADNIINCLTFLSAVLLYIFTLLFILCGANLVSSCLTFQLLQSIMDCLAFFLNFLLSKIKMLWRKTFLLDILPHTSPHTPCDKPQIFVAHKPPRI